MRHATPQMLKPLKPFFEKLGTLESLKEKKTGVYYFKSKAFLHFHEDDGRIFADVKLNPPAFDRVPATTETEQADLFESIRAFLE
ncbi:MAG: hypothetical protein GKR90_12815 [Pseudomonadales bacterium]|nr:hypothetical protein [Pseudomonadales bacterium]